MSFPRAKLHRFNDTQACTPSPADYNVSVKSHVAGAVISKSDRFSEIASPSLSDNSSFVSSNGKPTFRTPNPPRKLKRQASADTKTKPLELFRSADEIEALKEKIVECNNKDLFIQELTEQIEEMKQQLSDLESQITLLKGDKQQLQKNLDHLNEGHEKSLKDLQKDHQNNLGKLCEQVSELNKKMQAVKAEYLKLKQENERDLGEVLKSIEMLEQLHDVLNKSYQKLLEQKTSQVEIQEKQILDLEEQCHNLKSNYQQQISNTEIKHKEEIQNVEYEMLKTVTEMQREFEKEKEAHARALKESVGKFNNFQAQVAQEKLQLQEDSEAKIHQLIENFKETTVLAEIQMKEKCSDIELGWKLKFEESKQESDAILKECQAIAEYNIIQCEIEKNKALYDLSEQQKNVSLLKTENAQIKSDYYNIETKYQLLQTDHSELNTLHNELHSQLLELQTVIEHLTKDKHTYEVTISKTHKTVEMLKKRLMRSDQDVEQLKAELEATEESKLEFEGKCNQLTDELQIVCGLCDDMDEQNSMALRVAEEKVLSVELRLLEKVDEYKDHANEKVATITKELEKTKTELSVALAHLHEQQKINIEAHQLISISQEETERIDSINNENINKINHLESTFNNIQTELTSTRVEASTLTKTITLLKEENKKYQVVIKLMHTKENSLLQEIQELKEKCTAYEEARNEMGQQEEKDMEIRGRFDELLQKYKHVVQNFNEMEERNRNLQKIVADQESLIGPFRDHLEAYEMEYNALMNEKQSAEKEAKEMGLKYAEILGHQNQKQKIKHLIDLKKKNFELSANNHELENKVRSHLRTIDRLKSELSLALKSQRKLQKTQDKENVSSPNRTLNSSRVDSPLRDRN